MIRATVDTLTSALRVLGAHKLRSALTLLGIVIGVVSVVAMAATTEGLRRRINEDLGQLGSGVFQVQKWPIFGNRHRPEIERRKNFTMADVELLREKCRTCLRVGGETWTMPMPVTAGDRTTGKPVWIVGGTEEFFDNNGYGLASGHLFEAGEVAGDAQVAVIGSDLVDTLFPGEEPLGKFVRIKDASYRVVGTLERRGSNMGGSIDGLIALPMSTFLLRYGQRQSLNITIQVRDPARVKRSEDEVVALLRKARAVPPEAENDFEVFSNASLRETFEEISGTIVMASIGITAIALLIGGIGVMNIMLVAVTERTSEIGLRRAMGARRRRILSQFVVEAVMLTTLGGLLGILLGAGVSALVKVLVDIPTVIPAWAILLSILSAGGVGLIFGIYPAWRASRLDPVEAMRHE